MNAAQLLAVSSRRPVNIANKHKMHSSLVRIQNVFGFFTTVAFSLGLLIALSVVVSHQNPTAELELRNVQV